MKQLKEKMEILNCILNDDDFYIKQGNAMKFMELEYCLDEIFELSEIRNLMMLKKYFLPIKAD